jgi:hypothetical protein
LAALLLVLADPLVLVAPLAAKEPLVASTLAKELGVAMEKSV